MNRPWKESKIGKLVVVTFWQEDAIYWGYLTAYDEVESWVELERMIGTPSVNSGEFSWSKQPKRLYEVYNVRLATAFDEQCMGRVIELCEEQRRENALRNRNNGKRKSRHHRQPS